MCNYLYKISGMIPPKLPGSDYKSLNIFNI
jgi:hypothetical protein